MYEGVLVEDVCYTQQREPRVQPQPKYSVAQEAITLDHRRTPDSDQRNLNELQSKEVHPGHGP